METKVKLPKKLKVGGIIYKVLYPYLFIEDTSIVGLHEPSTAIIKIAGVNDSKFLCAERILETFLHESVHAIDYVYCNEQYNEDDVEAISKALFATSSGVILSISSKSLTSSSCITDLLKISLATLLTFFI
jgi:hypothetical protein